MAAKKTTPSRRRKTTTEKMPMLSTAEVLESLDKRSKAMSAAPRMIAILLAIVVIGLIVWKGKGLLLAGMVNNRPIWRWDLESRLIAKDGQATFDEMVNEALIRNEASKKGISASQTEVDNRIKEIEASLEGKVSLSDALSQQGMTMGDFRRQVELQIIVEKMTVGQISVTQEEIDKYIADNKDFITATDEAGINQEARQNLTRQKQSDAFQKIFDDLKKNSKVQKFF